MQVLDISTACFQFKSLGIASATKNKQNGPRYLMRYLRIKTAKEADGSEKNVVRGRLWRSVLPRSGQHQPIDDDGGEKTEKI